MRRFAVCLAVGLVACGSSEQGVGEVGGAPGFDGGAGLGAPGTGGAKEAGGVGGAGPDGGGSGGASGSGTGGKAGGGDSGGLGGFAGAGGTKDAGAIVRDCAGLPAAGQWEEISPTAFHTPSNMETLSVVVSQPDQTVYAAAGNKTNGGNSGTGVYKSTDCGATFTLVSTGTNSDKIMTGDPWAMLIDPVNPQTLYVNNGYGNDATIYKSKNGGVDWIELYPNTLKPTVAPFVEDIALEATNPEHLAVTFHENCSAPYNGMCLSQSTDGGATWRMFDGPAVLTGWQEAATLTILGATSYLYMAEGAWLTTDGGTSWTKVVNQHFGGGYAGSTDMAPDGTLYLAGSNPLFSSHSTPLGSSFTAVSNSPITSTVADDEVNLFVSYSWDSGGQPFWTAKLSNPTAWTHMPSPQISRGSDAFAYDKTHHILYSANWAAGLWRLVTR